MKRSAFLPIAAVLALAAPLAAQDFRLVVDFTDRFGQAAVPGPVGGNEEFFLRIRAERLGQTDRGLGAASLHVHYDSGQCEADTAYGRGGLFQGAPGIAPFMGGAVAFSSLSPGALETAARTDGMPETDVYRQVTVAWNFAQPGLDPSKPAYAGAGATDGVAIIGFRTASEFAPPLKINLLPTPDGAKLSTVKPGESKLEPAAFDVDDTALLISLEAVTESAVVMGSRLVEAREGHVILTGKSGTVRVPATLPAGEARTQVDLPAGAAATGAAIAWEDANGRRAVLQTAETPAPRGS